MLTILTAAGGNPTALWRHDPAETRQWYADRGAALMAAGAGLSALHGSPFPPEQAGFLSRTDAHLEMAGGELCGNATLSAAALIGRTLQRSRFPMTTSDGGYRRPITVQTRPEGGGMRVTATFTGLPLHAETVGELQVVDMGGIVHVLVPGDFPDDYRRRHRQITDALGLSERPAVGVSWFARQGAAAAFHPVVRVSSGGAETFIYESACGSGSIALAAATGCREIIQPTRQRITVDHAGEATALSAVIRQVLTARVGPQQAPPPTAPTGEPGA